MSYYGKVLFVMNSDQDLTVAAPLLRSNSVLELPERFWAKIDQSLKHKGCCICTGAKQSAGYGHFKVDGKMVLAHRLTWEHFNGPIPDGRNLLHVCDNPPCVTPLHHFTGTQLDNIVDMYAKGRRIVGGSSSASAAARGPRRHPARVAAEPALERRE